MKVYNVDVDFSKPNKIHTNYDYEIKDKFPVTGVGKINTLELKSQTEDVRLLGVYSEVN